MSLVGFETTISAGERPQTYALDRAATGTGCISLVLEKVKMNFNDTYLKYSFHDVDKCTLYIQDVPGGMCQTSGGCSVY